MFIIIFRGGAQTIGFGSLVPRLYPCARTQTNQKCADLAFVPFLIGLSTSARVKPGNEAKGSGLSVYPAQIISVSFTHHNALCVEHPEQTSLCVTIDPSCILCLCTVAQVQLTWDHIIDSVQGWQIFIQTS